MSSPPITHEDELAPDQDDDEDKTMVGELAERTNGEPSPVQLLRGEEEVEGNEFEDEDDDVFTNDGDLTESEKFLANLPFMSRLEERVSKGKRVKRIIDPKTRHPTPILESAEETAAELGRGSGEEGLLRVLDALTPTGDEPGDITAAGGVGVGGGDGSLQAAEGEGTAPGHDSSGSSPTGMGSPLRRKAPCPQALARQAWPEVGDSDGAGILDNRTWESATGSRAVSDAPATGVEPPETALRLEHHTGRVRRLDWWNYAVPVALIPENIGRRQRRGYVVGGDGQSNPDPVPPTPAGESMAQQLSMAEGESVGDYGRQVDSRQSHSSVSEEGDDSSVAQTIIEEKPDIGSRFPSFFWQQKRLFDGTPMLAGDVWQEQRDRLSLCVPNTVEVIESLSKGQLTAEVREAAVQSVMQMCEAQEDLYGGFLLIDACRLVRVLTNLLQTVECHEEFRDPVVTILSMLRKPMLMRSSLQFNEHVAALFHLANIVGQFVTSMHDDVAESAIAYLCQCMTATDWPSIHDAVRDIYLYRPAPYDLHEAAMESSYATLLLTKAWVPGSKERRHSWIQEALLIFVAKDPCRQQIAKSERAMDMISALAECSIDSRTHQVILLLINCLLIYEDDHLKVAEEIACEAGLRILRNELRQLLRPHLTKLQMNTRNEIAHILLLLACQVPSAPFVSAGVLKDICLLATFTEVKSSSLLVCDLDFKEYPDDDDFMHADISFKMTLLLFFTAVAGNAWTVGLMREQLVIPALLTFISSDMPENYAFEGQSYLELQQVAMVILLRFAPTLVDEITSYHGTTRILVLLDHLCQTGCRKARVSADGKVLGPALTGVRQMALLLRCFQLLYTMLCHDDLVRHQVRSDLLSQGAAAQFRNFVLEVVSLQFTARMKHDSQDKDLTRKLHSATLLAMECLNLLHCDSHPQYDPSDEQTTSFLHTLVSQLSGSANGMWMMVTSSDESIPIAFLNSIWWNVVNDTACEEHFYQSGQIYKLFDALQKSRRGLLRNHLVRILSDLADNSGNITHFQTWGAPGTGHKENAFTLLLRIWRESDVEHGVQRDDRARIADSSAPLLGARQALSRQERRQERGLVDKSSLPAVIRTYPALIEVKVSPRAAIANILLRLGSPTGALSQEDFATYSLVQCHLDMKICETVQELVEDLDRRHFRIADECRAVMAEYLHMGVLRSETAQSMQISRPDVLDDTEETEDRTFYQKIAENFRLGQEPTAGWKQQKRKMDATKDIDTLKHTAQLRKKKVEEARARNPNQTGGLFHDVTLPALRTSVPSQEVTIECTPSLLTSVRSSQNTTARQSLAKTLLHFKEDEYAVPQSPTSQSEELRSTQTV